MLDEIETNAQWNWARNSIEDIQHALKELRNAGTTFSRQWVSMELPDMKKLYDSKTLLAHLNSYIGVQEPLVAAVLSEIRMLTSMDAAKRAGKQ